MILSYWYSLGEERNKIDNKVYVINKDKQGGKENFLKEEKLLVNEDKVIFSLLEMISFKIKPMYSVVFFLSI